MESPEGIRTLIKLLIGTGGSNIEDAVQRTMEKLLEDSLASKFSLMGMRGKLKFTDYPATISAIRESIQSYPSLSQIVASGQLGDKSFKTAMQASFKRVCDRVFRRSNKRMSSFDVATSSSRKSVWPNEISPQAVTFVPASALTSPLLCSIDNENVHE
ncbi:unnamed protein product [Orchesella dallaii]|uniref:Uncharacterized protein n=1 Tax=Orchesella dallaii TaxID=48710 RepID=A0ABP1PIK6_9HEXA